MLCPLFSLILKICTLLSGPGSVVGIATGYGLDGPGIESRWGGARFSAPVQTGPGAHPASCTQWVPCLSRGERTASYGCELANLGTKLQHATSRPPKPLKVPNKNSYVLTPTPYTVPLPRWHHGVHQEHFAVVLEVPWRTSSVSVCEDTPVMYYIVHLQQRFLVLCISIFNVTTGDLTL